MQGTNRLTFCLRQSQERVGWNFYLSTLQSIQSAMQSVRDAWSLSAGPGSSFLEQALRASPILGYTTYVYCLSTLISIAKPTTCESSLRNGYFNHVPIVRCRLHLRMYRAIQNLLPFSMQPRSSLDRCNGKILVPDYSHEATINQGPRCSVARECRLTCLGTLDKVGGIEE